MISAIVCLVNNLKIRDYEASTTTTLLVIGRLNNAAIGAGQNPFRQGDL